MADIARQLNVEVSTIKKDLKLMRNKAPEAIKAQSKGRTEATDYLLEALEISRENVHRANREAAKLTGSQGAAVATKVVQATSTHLSTLQQLGIAQKAVERVEHSGAIMNDPFERGMAMVIEAIAAEEAGTKQGGQQLGRKLLRPFEKKALEQKAREEGLLTSYGE
jgi:hypothetical protein